MFERRDFLSIVSAAGELDQLRSNWLNPPEWSRTEILEFPGSVDGPWARYIDGAGTTNSRGSLCDPQPHVREGGDVVFATAPSGPDGATLDESACQPTAGPPLSSEGLAGLHAIRYPRLVPKDEACAKELKKRG
jgi:hypothetical protein